MLGFIENMKIRKVRKLAVEACREGGKNGKADEFYKMALLQSGIDGSYIGSRDSHRMLWRCAKMGSGYGLVEQGLALYSDAMKAAIVRKEYLQAIAYAADASSVAEVSGSPLKAMELMAAAGEMAERYGEPALALEAYASAAKTAYGAGDYANALKYADMHERLAGSEGLIETTSRKENGKFVFEENALDSPLTEEQMAKAKEAVLGSAPSL